jgi:hypothetical protein
MIFKGNPDNRARVIVVTCLDYVGPIPVKCLCGLLRWPNYGYVPRFVLVRVRKNDYHQVATIGLLFRRPRPGQPTPSLASACSLASHLA